MVKEKINPWEFLIILIPLSKIKEQETFIVAQSSFETTLEMLNKIFKLFTELLLQLKVR